MLADLSNYAYFIDVLFRCGQSVLYLVLYRVKPAMDDDLMVLMY